jgi:hypothetical protein
VDRLIGRELRLEGPGTHDISPLNSCETSKTCEKSGTGEADDGSRFEVRGFGNFEPRTSDFVSPLLRAVLFPMLR